MGKVFSVVALMGLLLEAAAQAAGPAQPSPQPGDPPLLLRFPTVSRTQIVFNYAGDLWVVSREGGEARQLTSGVGVETFPHFSPDGTLVAFTGEYDGNQDVYVVPVTGGVPRRLTYHPADDTVLGWTPDGTRILFSSARNSFRHFENQLYTVPVTGGYPTPLPLPIGVEASFSPDGQHLAYVPHPQWQQESWKRYRGGQTTPVWIADLKDSSIAKVPRENSNDHFPMWVADTVYFLSDRNGPVSLFAYDSNTRQVTEALHSDGFDFKTASAGPDAIVIEQFGALKLYDLRTHQARNVVVRVTGDLAAVRPHFAKVEPHRVQNFNFSPTGARAVFEAWGEIFTVPTDKGDIRNITRSPAVADRDPAWSPDGKWIAWFSDEPGEYELHIRDQAGLGEVRRIALSESPSFFYSPLWSPDSKKIVYADKHLGLWYVDVQTKVRKRIDEDYYGGFGGQVFSPAWSPDNRWVTYTKQLPSGLHAVFVYSLEQGKSFQVTDGMSDALFPAFDRNGKYLYFTASTDVALTAQVLDMSSNGQSVSRSVYVVVLSKDERSPLAPESDEDKGASNSGAEGPGAPGKTSASGRGDSGSADRASAGSDHRAGQAGDEGSADRKESGSEEAGKAHGGKGGGRGGDARAGDGKGKSSALVKIDFDGISQRILALPIPSKRYDALATGKSGVVFLAEGPQVLPARFGDVPHALQKFDLGKRKLDKLADEVVDFSVSFDGEKLLYRRGDQWLAASTDGPSDPSAPPKPGLGPLKVNDWQVYVEPRAMWHQMYDEAWRIERDFFYDPHYHGLDLEKAKRKYAPYLAGIASRDELTYLFNESLGELTVGHLFVSGGDRPDVKRVKAGLLGADYSVENGRYRIARVFDGENWNPDLQAPLTQPGVNVKAGEYVLAVNSRDLHSSDDIFSFFEATAGKQVVLKVGARPDGQGARDVTVVPVESEEGLRHLAWIEANRRRVDQATGGRVAYLYLPDTGNGGFSNFNRYFFSQVGKEGVIVDERFNEGGQLADYIIDHLRRPLMSKVVSRDGHDWSSPSQAIYGPKVMLINQMSGSGGDALPWYFRKAEIGPLIGKRTWGGLVGIGGYPQLIDGGMITAPRAAIYGLQGEWEVENHGIPPDYDVDLDPQAFRNGRDSQLEKGIEVVMQLLKDHPLPQYARPAFPNYHEHDDLGASPASASQSNAAQGNKPTAAARAGSGAP